jgi:hypothetical protein
MKKIILHTLLYIFAFTTTNSFAQTLDYVWTQQGTGNYTDAGASVATDASGNVIVVGTIYSSSVTFGNITLTKADSTDGHLYVVKYSPTGTVLWAEMAELDYTYGYSVATDLNGDIYIAGELWGDSARFGGITIALGPSAGNAGILVKYSSSGTALWAKMGLAGRGVSGVATDANGDVYFTGIFNNQMSFDGNFLNSTGACYGIFLAKYDGQGNFIWAKATNYSLAGMGTPDAGSNSICTDANNNVYLTGYFGSDTIKFDNHYVTNDQSTRNAFIAKYDNLGNVLWAKAPTSTPSLFRISTNGITTLGNSVYVTGDFEGDSVWFGTNLLTKYGSYSEIFLAKYDDMGTILWAKSLGTGSVDYGNELATDNAGNVYLAGTTNGEYFQVNGTIIDTFVGGNNALVAKFDPNGNFLLAQTPLNLTGQSTGQDMVIDANDNIFVTGSIYGSVLFGSDTLTCYNQWEDMFVTKINYVPTSVHTIATNETTLKIFPNPASDFIVLDLSDKSNKTFDVKIYNTLGSLVQFETFDSNYNTIHIGGLANGVYILTVEADGVFGKEKFVVER